MMTDLGFVPSKHSYQLGYLSSLNIVFTVCMERAQVVSFQVSVQQRLCSGWSESSPGA